MMNLKIYFVLILLVVSGCASQSVYKPAAGSSPGYSEKLLGENYYRVQFKAIGETRANNYALLRAAELTHEQGYDWFVVTKRDTRVEKAADSSHQHLGGRQLTTQQCGLLGCRTNVATLPDSGVRPMDEGSTITPVTVALDIRLGKGTRPASKSKQHGDKTPNENYDALETIERLKPKAN